MRQEQTSGKTISIRNDVNNNEQVAGYWQKRGLTSGRPITIELFQLISSAQNSWAELPADTATNIPSSPIPDRCAQIIYDSISSISEANQFKQDAI